MHTLRNPTVDEFGKALESVQPNILYLQGEQLVDGEFGSLFWGGVDLSTPEAICGLFSTMLPTTVRVSHIVVEFVLINVSLLIFRNILFALLLNLPLR